MKTLIKAITTLVAVMGAIHIAATFSPLIGGKLVGLDAGTYSAMIYMSLMCGLLLIVLGFFMTWAINKVTEHKVLTAPLITAAALTLADGVMAVCYMPHNPFAWTIAVLCVAAFAATQHYLKR